MVAFKCIRCSVSIFSATPITYVLCLHHVDGKENEKRGYPSNIFNLSHLVRGLEYWVNHICILTNLITTCDVPGIALKESIWNAINHFLAYVCRIATIEIARDCVWQKVLSIYYIWRCIIDTMQYLIVFKLKPLFRFQLLKFAMQLCKLLRNEICSERELTSV